MSARWSKSLMSTAYALKRFSKRLVKIETEHAPFFKEPWTTIFLCFSSLELVPHFSLRNHNKPKTMKAHLVSYVL